jgi:Zn-dependent M28 family amino/carboxypeptidase
MRIGIAGLWTVSAALAVMGTGSVGLAQGAGALEAGAQVAVPQAVKAAEASIDPEKIRAQVRFLSDDLLEGRGPGLRGGELAAKYIATQFALAGLKPGGDNGTYLQEVKFVGVKAKPEATSFELLPLHGQPEKLVYGEEYTANNEQHTPVVDFDAPIVFVGYGIRAPEFGWDDYKGVDVKGKVVLVIVNEPPSDDPKFFAGAALTYYGRWMYKFEEAARMGAVGALIIHRTDLASYGWDVVQNSFTSEKTYLAEDPNPKLEAASWIQLAVARKLLATGGLNLDAEIAAAGKRGFKAVELPVRLKAHVESVIRPYESPNVVGILPGANAGGKDQAVVFSAHYDHLGFVPGMKGDNVYNGAVDNGSGCGMLLEMARAWAGLVKSGVKLPHSAVFASVTAEEQGLLGSEYLAQHSPIPVGQIALDINYDMVLPIGIPQQINVNGAQRTSFFPVVQATARRFGLTIVPDPRPAAGTYYRSDHFSLSKVGIPAFTIEPGMLYEGHDEAWGRAKMTDFNLHDYHNFSDNYHADWDFRGNAKLDRFGMELGWEAISAPATIRWNAGDEFEAARKASLRQ